MSGRDDPGSMGPLDAGRPAVGGTCPCCGRPVGPGDVVTLVPVVPADEREAAKARAGPAHTSAVEVVHWGCRGWRGPKPGAVT